MGLILPIFFGFVGLYFLPNLIDWKMRGAYSHSDDRFSAGARVLSGPKQPTRRFWQEAPLILGGTVQRPTTYSMSARKELESLQKKRKQAREFRVRAAKRRLFLVLLWAVAAVTVGSLSIFSLLHWAWVTLPLGAEVLTLSLGAFAAKRGRENDANLSAKITRLEAQILPVATSSLSATAKSLQAQQISPAPQSVLARGQSSSLVIPEQADAASSAPTAEAMSVLDRLIATYQKAKVNAAAAFASDPVTAAGVDSSEKTALPQPETKADAAKTGASLALTDNAKDSANPTLTAEKPEESIRAKTAKADSSAGGVEEAPRSAGLSSSVALQASQSAIAPVSATLTSEAAPSGAIPMPIPVYKRKKAVLGVARELSDPQGRVQKVTLPYRPDQVRSSNEPSLSTGELAVLDSLEKVIENRRVTSA